MGVPSIGTLKSRMEAYQSWSDRKRLIHEGRLRAGKAPITRNVARAIISTRSKKDWLRESFNQLSPTLRSIGNSKTAKAIIKRIYK